jgi:hypothetical protein
MLSLCLSPWLFLNKWAHTDENRRGTLSSWDIPAPHFYYNNEICIYKVLHVSTLKDNIRREYIKSNAVRDLELSLLQIYILQL